MRVEIHGGVYVFVCYSVSAMFYSCNFLVLQSVCTGGAKKYKKQHHTSTQLCKPHKTTHKLFLLTPTQNHTCKPSVHVAPLQGVGVGLIERVGSNGILNADDSRQLLIGDLCLGLFVGLLFIIYLILGG